MCSTNNSDLRCAACAQNLSATQEMLRNKITGSSRKRLNYTIILLAPYRNHPAVLDVVTKIWVGTQQAACAASVLCGMHGECCEL